MNATTRTASCVWLIEQGRHPTLAELLGGAGHAADVAKEGRVFVDGRRVVEPSLVLEAGQRVELFPQRRRDGEAQLLDQRSGFVAALKPPELPTEPDHHGLDSLRMRVAEMAGIREDRLHAVSRLDVGVSGVVLFASAPVARRHVESVRRRGALRRRYVGIAERAPTPRSGVWNEPIARQRGRARLARSDGLPAITHFSVVGECDAGVRSVGRGAGPLAPALLALEPRTGRTHQIRVHAAHAGAPLLGDRLYGGAVSVAFPDGRVLEVQRIALHAAWIELPDLEGRAWRVPAPAPLELQTLWEELGGCPELLDAAAGNQCSGLPGLVE